MSTFAPLAPTTYVPPTKVASDTYVIHQVQPALGEPRRVRGEQPVSGDAVRRGDDIARPDRGRVALVFDLGDIKARGAVYPLDIEANAEAEPVAVFVGAIPGVAVAQAIAEAAQGVAQGGEIGGLCERSLERRQLVVPAIV